MRFVPLQQPANLPSRADSAPQTLATCSDNCQEGSRGYAGLGVRLGPPHHGGVCSPEPPLGFRRWVWGGSLLPYLLMHAVLGHRVAALRKHLGGVFCQGEEVLKGSIRRLLSQRGEVAGQAQGERGAWGAQLPSPPGAAPSWGFTS